MEREILREALRRAKTRREAAASLGLTRHQFAYRAKVPGWYYVEAKLVAPTHDPIVYALAVATRRR